MPDRPSNHGATPEFREWIDSELESRGWTRARLAREIDVHKGAVHKWMLPDGNLNARRPGYENCYRLAALFGRDVNDILRMLKIPGAPEVETKLQREVKAMIHLIPDWMLLTVKAQLAGIIHGRDQRQLVSEMRTEINDENAVLVRGIDLDDPTLESQA